MTKRGEQRFVKKILDSSPEEIETMLKAYRFAQLCACITSAFFLLAAFSHFGSVEHAPTTAFYMALFAVQIAIAMNFGQSAYTVALVRAMMERTSKSGAQA